MKKRNINDLKKRLYVFKYDFIRYKLKFIINNTQIHPAIRYKAQLKLNNLIKNSSKIRLKNRCVLTGRSRSVYKHFKLSRIMFRELALKGLINGVRKASW